MITKPITPNKHTRTFHKGTELLQSTNFTLIAFAVLVVTLSGCNASTTDPRVANACTKYETFWSNARKNMGGGESKGEQVENFSRCAALAPVLLEDGMHSCALKGASIFGDVEKGATHCAFLKQYLAEDGVTVKK